jgi:hemerythrin-like domain-containing protein
MGRKTFKHDLTVMYIMHDALRRELEIISRIAAKQDDDPQTILRTALGWEMFKNYLRVHHGAEDDVLWPEIRKAIGDRQNELDLLNAMDAEHAAVEPGLAAMDAALADRENGPARIAMIAERMSAGLGGHLKHEEDEALDVIDAYATPELLQRFGVEHNVRVGKDGPKFLPWLLDGASDDDVKLMVGNLPAPLQLAYQNEWQPGYVALNRWSAGSAR